MKRRKPFPFPFQYQSIGSFDAAETVQVYVQSEEGEPRVLKAYKNLPKARRRKAGKHHLDEDAFSRYDEEVKRFAVKRDNTAFSSALLWKTSFTDGDRSLMARIREIEEMISRGPFTDDWGSLQKKEFRNGSKDKFGIFIHWGVYSVPLSKTNGIPQHVHRRL